MAPLLSLVEWNAQEFSLGRIEYFLDTDGNSLRGVLNSQGTDYFHLALGGMASGSWINACLSNFCRADDPRDFSRAQ
jgi:hypothetical protein